MSYTDVFGGTNIYPADVSYFRAVFAEDIQFEWPLESAAPVYPLARIIDLEPLGAFTARMPNATEVSVGQVVLFNNVTASGFAFIVDFAGNPLVTIPPGEQWQLYLTDNTTPGGLWQTFRFGASTASVNPVALAGFGITATGTTLSQSVPVHSFSSTPRDLTINDRASAFVWTGSGAAVVNLPGVVGVGNNWFTSVRNAGGGDVVVEPSGFETIDDAANLRLSPGEGVLIITNGVEWYTLGLGQAAVFAFDFTVIDLTGSGPTYTLSGPELNRVAYKFIGALTTNVAVVVPPTVQQYWVHNATTGSFTLALSTPDIVAPIVVPQGARGIYYCDGTDVIDADTATLSTPISVNDGGTGINTYAEGDMLYATAPFVLDKLPIAPAGNALISNGLIPAWGQIDLTTTVTGVLPPANGGTGGSDPLADYARRDTSNIFLDPLNMFAAGRMQIAAETPASTINFSLVASDHLTALGQINYGLSPGRMVMVNLTSGGHLDLAQVGPGYITINTDNIERVRVDATGNVGIGTNAPAAKLDVAGQVRSNASSGGDASGFFVSSAAPTVGWQETAAPVDYRVWDLSANSNCFFGRIINDAATVVDNWLQVTRTGAVVTSVNFPAVGGKVGIGNNAPAAKLDITGNNFVTGLRVSGQDTTGNVPDFTISRTGAANAAIAQAPSLQFYNPTEGKGSLIQGSGSDMQFFTFAGAWAERMRIAGNGNVGIGTAVPSDVLDVWGGSFLRGRIIQSHTGDDFRIIFMNAATSVQQGFIFHNGSQMIIGNVADTGPFTLRQVGVQPITFETNGAERMRVNGDGKVGIGTPGPTTLLDVRGVASTNPSITLSDNAGSVAIVQSAGASYCTMGALSATALYLVTSNALRIGLTLDGLFFYPHLDSATSLGGTSNRWTEVCAVNGTINTSDAREKTALVDLTTAELAAAKTIARGIGTYRWLDASIDADLHVGVTAQDVIAAMAEQGLDALAYGMVRYDEWEASEGVAAVEASPAVTDKATGDILQAEVNATPGIPATPAGSRYSTNSGEIAMFIAAAQEQRLAALEAILG